MAHHQSPLTQYYQSPGRNPLAEAIDRWLADAMALGCSHKTLANRRHILGHFALWLEDRQGPNVSPRSLTPSVLRAFFGEMRSPRLDGRSARYGKTATLEYRPSTIHTYYACLRAFANFLVEEGDLEVSPFKPRHADGKGVKPPQVPEDQVQPLSAEQVQSLLDAARRHHCPERDVAILLVLLDSGVRVKELCRLNVEDFSRGDASMVVLGKGNKTRQVFLGVTARRALFRYLETRKKTRPAGDLVLEPKEPLILSFKGPTPESRMTPQGIWDLLDTLRDKAGLRIRVGPHKLRHTFAVNFLRGGGDIFELQQIMGHKNLETLRRYVLLAQSDLEAAHRKASPADRMGLK
jgi:site-specific recombinase XerD